MGYLTYGNTNTPVEVDDELLAHVRVVTVTKLRRNESFALTLQTRSGGSETLWVHASIPLRFELEEPAELQRTLLVSLMDAANSSSGLDLTRAEFRELASGARHLHAMSA